MKTAAAVDHDKQGTKTNGFGQLVAANEAIYQIQKIVLHFDFNSSIKLTYMTSHR